jgi:hypothetical protein
MGLSVLRGLRAVGVTAGLVGVGLWSWRLFAQGEFLIWTDPARGFYLDDPDLGLVPTADRWLWLGLDGLAVIVGLLAATGLGLALSRGDRTSHGGLRRLVMRASLLTGLALLAAPVLPILAASEGLPPEGVLAHLSATDIAPAASGASEVIALPVPGGAWQLVPGSGLVVAKVTAGGDTFDVRFGGLEGSLSVDPSDLAASTVTLSVDAKTADAGIPLRSKHAQEMLKAEEFPAIRLQSGALLTRRLPVGPVRWEGKVRVTVAGREIEADASGELRLLGPAGRAKLGVAANEALMVEGRVMLAAAGFAADPATFEGGVIPIATRAVFVPKMVD